MNERRILSELQARFDKNSLINACGGERCKVDMDGMPSERVIVNLENEFKLRKKEEKRCDQLLFFIHPTENNLVATTIELKSGKAAESDVIEKTENSLKFIVQIAPVSMLPKIVYNPILFEGRGIKSSNPKGAKQLEVSFRGKRLRILRGRCGGPRNLARALFG